ncbi:MAG: hypothetical protein HKN33_09370 [Pyrinomonadaceae bacterium]|nr:hypothetical protein [Pyrinomonadaceae bacterium]
MVGRTAAILFVACLVFTGSILAQNVPPPPKPIIETELRDNSIKIRAIELERVKRDAHKVQPDPSSKEWKKKFRKTKKFFENIQKLQDKIIAAYTTSERIDYSGISRSASKLNKNAVALEKELFGKSPDADKTSDQKEPEGVRDLIIQLDNALGKFVSSPMFTNTKIVDKDVSQAAQTDLQRVIELSILLFRSARST